MASSTLDRLIDLKFSLEREISLYYELTNKFNKNQLTYDNDGLQDYNLLLTKYRNNLFSLGEYYIDSQKNILEEINNCLFKICKHEWIEDTIEDGFKDKNICYCRNCFLKK